MCQKLVKSRWKKWQNRNFKKNVYAQKLIQNPEKAHKIKENKEKKDEKNNTKWVEESHIKKNFRKDIEICEKRC